MRRRPAVWALVAVAALALVAVALRALFLRGAFLPGWARWHEPHLVVDLDADGVDEELVVGGRRARVLRAGTELCATDADWLVFDAGVGDVDEDGSPEAVLLAWRRGDFGTSRPFWVERGDEGFSQHIFVMGLEDDQLVPEWMSSAVSLDMVGLRVGEDGRLAIEDRQGETSVWEWQGWSFVLAEDEAMADGGDGTPGDSAPEAPLTGDGADVRGDADGTLTLLVVGDCIAHDALLARAWDARRGTYDFSPLFDRVRRWVSSFDVAVATQETPLVGEDGQVGGFPRFGTPREFGDALVGAGFDVVASATNHVLDRGVEGLDGTLAFWRDTHPEVLVLGIRGAGEEPYRAIIMDREGYRLAFFDATYGLNGLALPEGRTGSVDLIGSGDDLVEGVRQAEGEADLTVCVLHIGEEYAKAPTEEQRALERRLAEAGADLIVCSHTHTLQGFEEIAVGEGRRAIAYHGLGDFVSSPPDEGSVLGGAVELEVTRDEDGVVRIGSHRLVGIVSHVSPEEAATYRLDDYGEELASQHALNLRPDMTDSVSMESLQRQLEALA